MLPVLPEKPMEILHADHFGQEARNKYKHVLLIVDAFLRFTWLYPIKSTSTKEVIKQAGKSF